MPHSRSAKKRVVQNEKSREANKALKSALRTQLKKVREAIEAGDSAKAEAELPAAMKHLDKAGKSRVLHPNKAAREKSRLQRDVNALKK
jgi:small subunit ribosomal protein S20